MGVERKRDRDNPESLKGLSEINISRHSARILRSVSYFWPRQNCFDVLSVK